MSAGSLIAIIDDDSSFRVAIEGLVRSLGHRALCFSSAEDFLNSSKRPDCIVTDIQMPGLSGIELKQELDSRGDTVPVIITTARTEPALIAKARQSGAHCVLQKPFESETFIKCLDGALE
ncbi:MAG: response regulator [Pseudomonadota bacterium]|nr:response regulator [Pseudomonadota bacterium]